MTEFELKLRIPPQRLARVAAALRRGRVSAGRLQAQYYDTPDRRLQAAGLVLRLRKEGAAWVQTAKGEGSGPLERLEDNVPVQGSRPVPDVTRHAATPLGGKLAELLAPQAGLPPPALELVHRTDIHRLTRSIRSRAGSVEVALDTGWIAAGDTKLPVCEIEFEAGVGDGTAAVRLAQAWCARHGLWLDAVGKGEKGLLLARGERFAPPVVARTPRFGRHAAAAQAVGAVLSECMRQVLGNASAVGDGCTGDEHIHQLRVGLRRLRTALRELDGIAGPFDPDWEPALACAFRELGRHRDQHCVLPTLQRQLEAAGGPGLAWPHGSGDMPDPQAVVQAPALQSVLIAIAGCAHALQAEPAADEPREKLRDPLEARLHRLHRQVRGDCSRFETLDEASRHRLRKRCKRLRYLAELLQPLYRPRRVDRTIDVLKGVQEALGEHLDALLAGKAWAARADAEPAAWFGVGWLAARAEALLPACARACRRYARQARPFWD